MRPMASRPHSRAAPSGGPPPMARSLEGRVPLIGDRLTDRPPSPHPPPTPSAQPHPPCDRGPSSRVHGLHGQQPRQPRGLQLRRQGQQCLYACLGPYPSLSAQRRGE
eukprot:2174447-Pyramimonas_sp.AAC.1